MALPDADRLCGWIESDGAVERCEFQHRDDLSYRLRVTTPDATLHVSRDDGDGPIRVVGTAEVPPEQLTAFGHDTDRQDLLGQLTAVVTSTDGRFALRDGDGDRCELREMRRVEFERRIYPGGGTRHEVMTAVHDIASAVGYLFVVLRNFHSYGADDSPF